MADNYSKILRMTALGVVGAALSLGASDHMIGNDVSGEGMKMPVYGEDKLDFIIISKEVIKTGEIINATEPIIEFIHPEANIDDITFMEEMVPYPLRENEAAIIEFWNNRLFSNALLSSPDSMIDQTSSIATSEGPVFFRSPVADLNGVGYVADYQNRTVLVRSKVEMVSRPSLQTPEAIAEAAKMERTSPDEAMLDTLQVWSDTLFIDMNNDQVTLTGEVQLKENRLEDLRCAKMVINFESAKEEEAAAEAPAGDDAEKQDQASQASEGDDAEKQDQASQAPEGEAAETAPVATEEAISSAQEEFTSSRKLSNIVCEGSVFVRDSRGDLFCDRMTIYFAEDELGKNEISKIICQDNIKLIGAEEKAPEAEPAETADAGGEAAAAEDKESALDALGGNISNGKLYADYGELDFPANAGVFKGEVIAVADNGTTLSCDELYFYTADLAEGDVIPEQEDNGEIPTRIGITEDKELIRVTALGNVQMESESPEDGRQVVTGSRATYTVGTREIEMVDEVKGMASLIRYKDKRKYMSRQIFIDAATGDARGVDFRSVPIR